jgi:hypothetical protein
MSIKPGISVADTKGIRECISRRSGAARIGPGDPAVSTPVSVALIWKVSGERLILPVSVGTKLQPKSPVPVAVILQLEQRISGTFLALPKQSVWRSDGQLRLQLRLIRISGCITSVMVRDASTSEVVRAHVCLGVSQTKAQLCPTWAPDSVSWRSS